MKICADHEAELSALLDGESDPATAVKLLDHVTVCTACSAFFRKLRSFQALVNELPEADQEQVSAPVERLPWHQRGLVPGWAWAAVGAFVIVAGLWAADVIDPVSPLDLPAETVIRLGEDRGQMDDARFVELASEILRSDKRYRDQMYIVLDEINRGVVSNESPLFDGVGEDAPSEFDGELASLTGDGPILD